MIINSFFCSFSFIKIHLWRIVYLIPINLLVSVKIIFTITFFNQYVSAFTHASKRKKLKKKKNYLRHYSVEKEIFFVPFFFPDGLNLSIYILNKKDLL